MARNRFDIILILLGLFGGAVLSNIVIALFPRSSIELRLSLSVVGALVGFVAGLAMSYAISASYKHAEIARYERIKAQLPPTAPTQIVGKKCTACQNGIIFATEGSFCPSCFEPYCDQCKALGSICQNCATTTSQHSQDSN